MFSKLLTRSIFAVARNTVKLLSQGGDMVELSRELRLPFVKWAVANQVFGMEFTAVDLISLFVR